MFAHSEQFFLSPEGHSFSSFCLHSFLKAGGACCVRPFGTVFPISPKRETKKWRLATFCCVIYYP